MRPYELMVIFDPELDDRQVGPTMEKFLNVVKTDGGSVANIDVWGRRRLAYPIRKKDEGSYVVTTFSSLPATAKELDRQLGLSELVMRTKLLRADA